MLITALILAGGRSRRMGQDKALISVNGEPLLARTARIAAACCQRVAIACPEVERYRGLLLPEVQWIPELQSDPAHPPGPLAALAAALPHLLSSDWILLLACDLPYLTPEQLRRWQGTLATLSREVLAAVPKTDQGWDPLVAFYRPSCLPRLRAWLSNNQHDFQGWLNQLGAAVATLPLNDPAVLFNCNTPTDLAQLSPEQIQPEIEQLSSKYGPNSQ